MNKVYNHFKTISKHKWYVFKACCRAGIPFRGIIHDMSKLSPIEFFESVKFYNGVTSPIPKAKEVQGCSYAWQHHKGRNPHHWEYWVDNLSDGGLGRPMPYKYAVEFLCDYIGAGQAYEREKWTFDRPYDYWAKQNKSRIHPSTVAFIDCILWAMKDEQNYSSLDKFYTRTIYNKCRRENA